MVVIYIHLEKRTSLIVNYSLRHPRTIHQTYFPPSPLIILSLFLAISVAEETADLVKDLLTSAGERDIYTGDFADICVISADGAKTERIELKFD